MASPIPKPDSQRVNRRKRPEVTKIEMERVGQPELPEDDGIFWPKVTRRWWKMWGDSPLSADFTDAEWSELLDTAIVHARHWSGDVRAAAELRQRTAKYGATPEDRLRLRIQFVFAESKEDDTGIRREAPRTTPNKPPPASARTRRGPLRSVPPPAS